MDSYRDLQEVKAILTHYRSRLSAKDVQVLDKYAVALQAQVAPNTAILAGARVIIRKIKDQLRREKERATRKW